MAEPQESLLSPEAENSTETTPWYSEDQAELVAKKGWQSPVDAVKSYSELERSMGSKVKLPSPESSAEEIRTFYQKMGCPENPDGYEIVVPEDLPEGLRDDGVESAIRQVAYENGVNKQAFEGIVKAYYDKVASDMRASREQGEAALREELKDKYDESLEIAKRFCGKCSDEFRDLLEKTGLGNNPVFIKEFISLGKKTLDDTLIKGTGEGEKTAYSPEYRDSPEMYRHGDDEESKKARAYFEARGFKY